MTTTWLSFNALREGEAFRFKADEQERSLPEDIRIAHRIKTGVRTYDTVWVGGEITSHGRVGCGDNPVERVS